MPSSAFPIDVPAIACGTRITRVTITTSETANHTNALEFTSECRRTCTRSTPVRAGMWSQFGTHFTSPVTQITIASDTSDERHVDEVRDASPQYDPRLVSGHCIGREAGP